ncbi:hypothetical protein NUSPORA_01472 [Nucleospora cyclopteri]
MGKFKFLVILSKIFCNRHFTPIFKLNFLLVCIFITQSVCYENPILLPPVSCFKLKFPNKLLHPFSCFLKRCPSFTVLQIPHKLKQWLGLVKHPKCLVQIEEHSLPRNRKCRIQSSECFKSRPNFKCSSFSADHLSFLNKTALALVMADKRVHAAAQLACIFLRLAHLNCVTQFHPHY